MNHSKKLLQSGRTAIGATADANSQTRLLASAGFDFLLFDTQHSTDDIKGLASAVTGLNGTSCSPIVRVGDLRPDYICRALDIGAKGIVVPMVNTVAEAELMVKWSRYPPAGTRSSAGARDDWGEFKSYREYMDAANEELLILPMIETADALAEVEDLAAVDGIDVLLVGPSDLSINLGVPLDYRNPKYLDALRRIGDACGQAGIAAGVYFAPPEIEPSELRDLGFAFFTLSWRQWAETGISQGLAALR